MGTAVTYRGPVDEADLTTQYRLPRDEGDLTFARGQVVEDVPADVVAELRAADDGHRFDFGEAAEAADAGAEPYPGYDDATAKDIGDRLAGSADVALAEAVVAYERAHENRKTVIEAAEAVTPPELERGP